jgi:hypothetical protein
MELTNAQNCTDRLFKKYESPGDEKFSIFVPDIKPSYHTVKELNCAEWIPAFWHYGIDHITACYVLSSVRGDKVLAKEIWCSIFQFLRFDCSSDSFVSQNALWRFTGYIPKELLTKKIFSFNDFDIEMNIIENKRSEIKLKNRALLDNKNRLNQKKVLGPLQNAQLISDNMIIGMRYETASANALHGKNNSEILLSFIIQSPLWRPFFCTSFCDARMDNQYSKDRQQRYVCQLPLSIDKDTEQTISFNDYIRSFYAWIDNQTQDIWLAVETMDEEITRTDAGAYRVASYKWSPSRHYINILKREKNRVAFTEVEKIKLPVLQLDMTNENDVKLFAHARFSIVDVIDGKIIVYDGLRERYLCFESAHQGLLHS